MKKITAVLTAIIIALCFYGCARDNGANGNGAQESAEPVTTSTTEATQRVTSTTSPVKKDGDKGEKLKKTLIGLIDGGKVYGTTDEGSFTLSLENADPQMFANEADEEYKEKALDESAKIVEAIKPYYNDEIKLDGVKINTIGSGDNGVDSCVYEVIYYNTQNQELLIDCDSNGKPYYVSCKFTW